MLRGPLGMVLGMGPGRLALLSGEPGGGKSSLAFSAFTDAWLVTTEMDPDQVRSYLERLRVSAARISEPRIDLEGDGAIDLGIDPMFRGDIIVDSISEFPDPVAALAAVRAAVELRQCRAIVIATETKDGLVRGSGVLSYQADVLIRVVNSGEGRVAQIGKNRCRGGSASIPFRFDREGRLAEPDWGPFYYVVDGPPGRLRLVAFPGGDAGKLADPVREAERGKIRLPTPPVALAAFRTNLTSSGWLEPADVEQRREFAERAGLRWAGPETFRSVGD